MYKVLTPVPDTARPSRGCCQPMHPKLKFLKPLPDAGQIRNETPKQNHAYTIPQQVQDSPLGGCIEMRLTLRHRLSV
jgi:hypothetical protein